VWPSTVVVEANLTVHVAALRRALGDGHAGSRYILNIPGRGYRFVAPVTLAEEIESPLRPPAVTGRQHNLPAQLTRLIGRDAVVNSLVQHLSAQRLLTIVGPGGIGKTAVALAIAERLLETFEDGVWVIDLAPTSDPRLVPTALASALRLEIRSETPVPGLVTALQEKRMLLVLDNCEHVIDAAAMLATAILRGARDIHILVTSREPLRIEGERIYRLSGLASPTASGLLTAAEVLSFPAARLFVERAAAATNDFELGDADAPSVGEICRNLDGIPLAIEFAAARVDTFGVQGVAARLDDRLRLLSGGHRTALPRHRTISTALDWSYQLLDEEERTVLRRLAIFAGGFTLDSASAIAAFEDRHAPDVADRVASLVTKSLVAADFRQGEVRFRLLETTRAYALAKLKESSDLDTLARRHAAYYRELVETASSRLGEGDLAAALAVEIDNIRAALTWALASTRDVSIGVALAAATAPIWLEMSLLTECHGWMAKALDLLDASERGTRREMVLQTELGLSLMYTQGMTGRTLAALTRASELAEDFQDPDYQLRALAALTMFRTRLEDHRGGLALARRSATVAENITDPVARSTVACILGAALLGLADYRGTLAYVGQALELDTPAVRRGQTLRTGRDHMTQARCVMTQALWHLGLLDQSAKVTRDVLADAQASGHPNSLCFALVWAGGVVFVLLGRGDIESAERSVAQLKELADKHGLSSYSACARGFEGLLSLRRGNVRSAERLLRTSLEQLRQTQYDLLYTPFLNSLAEVLAAAGEIRQSLAAIDEVLERCERSSALWWIPEALRTKGQILLLSNSANIPAAEDCFHRSLDVARGQASLSFELRTAMSLAQLHHAHGRTRQARDLLGSVYARFTEGFESTDLQFAGRQLEAWA
jgi:predicted ATPase